MPATPAPWNTRYPGYALVTGASAGLGAVFAERLAARKMPVVLVARRLERLDALAQELSARHGVEALCVQSDLTSPGAIPALVSALEGRHVSLLVNNAGFGLSSPFHLADPATLDAMVRLNCLVPTMLARQFVPPMIERRCGGHILLGSVAAFQPVGHFSVYAATKTYNLMLGEALWAEHRHLGVDTLVLAPGLTATEFQSVSGTKAIMGRMAPEPVVEAALRALGRRPTVVPGLANKVTTFMPRLAPRGALAILVEWLGRRMMPDTLQEAWRDAITRR